MLNVESETSLRQLLAASSDCELGSKLLVLSEALSGATRQTTDFMSAVSMDSVKYCQVCLDGTYSTSKCPFIADANARIQKRNANLR